MTYLYLMDNTSHNQIIENKESMLQEKLTYKKKRFRINTIELILGVIFLVISFQYLQTHPAERISVFSSIDSMVTKVENLFGTNSNIENQKSELEWLYRGVLSLSEKEGCTAPDLQKQITVRLNQLNNISEKEYSEQYKWFKTNLEIYAKQLVQLCPEQVQ